MKITKVNTMVGEFKSPVSTELSAVVERMQAPKTKEIADRIASIALQSRLMIRERWPKVDRELKSLVVEEMKEGGESWMNDIRTYIESAPELVLSELFEPTDVHNRGKRINWFL